MTRGWWLLVLALACGDDSGMDVDGGFDGGFDSGMTCANDSECDDGLFCNGTETCVEGACAAGAVVDCADAVECTVDLCDDEIDACVNAAPDADGDGVRDATCLDADGAPLGEDCDDDDGNRFPGNAEVCDEANHDEDCDPTTFGFIDRDLDGFADARCCNDNPEGGDPFCGNDCDDTRINVNIAATEACDGVDNDCNGSFDEGVLVEGLVDADGDGFGDPDMPLTACPGRGGFVPDDGRPTDCDDDDVARNPGQIEVCDGIDNDCDMEVDDDPQSVDWYLDRDGDGFGSAASGSVFSCETPDPVDGANYVLVDTDCNDDVAGINPSAAEACDGIDNDCNGEADFQIAPGDFEDDDGDGTVDIACGPPRGVDCDDLDPATGGGATESCDGRDNDCDERIDEGATDRQWFFDGDGDGHGTASNPANPPIASCMAPPGYTGSAGDCDDTDDERNPDASEECNATDDDCDGAVDEGGVCGCLPGFADCDGDFICETATSFDMNNCGACGSVCGLSENVTSSLCVSGDCRILDCVDGFENCDDMESNGCERAIDADPMNCGGCGNTCSASGPEVRGPLCIGGECELDCSDGFDDCDEFMPGCEADLSNDENNCGACGNRCDGPNYNCVGGTCAFDCIAGETADCDGDPSNGCEAFLGDPATCGGCASPCMPDTTTSAFCINEGGTFRCDQRCTDGNADCDGIVGNGCETMVMTSACDCSAGPFDCSIVFPGANTACAGSQPGTFGAQCEFRGCLPGLSDCGGTCVDLGSDDDFNCGGCGRICSQGCTAGMCTCSAGLTWCPFHGGDCVDLQADDFNCGTCGRMCEPDITTCVAGDCMAL